jgi:L-lactate dehydrogenase (cytochrome)
MGMCNLAGPGADRMLARTAAKHRVPVGVSTMASTSLEHIIEAAEGNDLSLSYCTTLNNLDSNLD